MQYGHLKKLVIGLLFVLLTSACAGNIQPTVAAKNTSKEDPAKTIVSDYENLKKDNFSHSTTIDHKWYPFEPGTQFVYVGSTKEDGEEIDHRVVTTVTDLTKVIDGIPSRVNYIEDYSSGQVIEAELAFFAQDNDGTVWRMGEHPEVYEEGVFIEAPTWISGIQDARAGIAMLADPQVGTPSYSQGWGPGVSFTDRGEVYETGMQVCTPLGCFEDVLVIKEASREEKDAVQFKYYAPGKYNVRVDWKGTEQKQEILELVEVNQLTPEALAEIREKALAVEKHAYEISKDVYALTPPMDNPTAVK
jgi:hypothetical protein